MSRIILLVLFIAACGRRETISGNWSGVAGPDGGAGAANPVQDESTPTRGNLDGSATKAAEQDVAPPPPGPELLAPDAGATGGGNALEVRAASPEGPGLAARDGGPDLGDARPCPDADRCD
jgi:hypothetical protein